MERSAQEFFIVYDAKSDEILACGQRDACCRALGKTRNAFRCVLAKVKAGTCKAYIITREHLPTGAYAVYGADIAELRKECSS